MCFLLCANVQTEIYKYMAWCLVLCAYHDIRTILRSEIWAFDNIHILSYSEPYMNRLCARGHAHPHIRTSFVFFAFINIHDSCVCVFVCGHFHTQICIFIAIGYRKCNILMTWGYCLACPYLCLLAYTEALYHPNQVLKSMFVLLIFCWNGATQWQSGYIWAS